MIDHIFGNPFEMFHKFVSQGEKQIIPKIFARAGRLTSRTAIKKISSLHNDRYYNILV